LPSLVDTLLLVEEATPVELVVALVEYGNPDPLYGCTEFHLTLTPAEATFTVCPNVLRVVTRKLAVHLYPLPLEDLVKLVMLTERPGAAGGGDGLQERLDMRKNRIAQQGLYASPKAVADGRSACCCRLCRQTC
jgi:hypothetical protein